MLETDDILVKHIPAHMRSFVVLSASVLFMFTLGIVYTFGNLLPYLVSYLRWKVDPNQTNGSMIWLQSFMTGVPCSMLFGGFLEKKIGARKGALIGSFIYTSAIAISYFSLQHSYILLLLTFGIMGSLGHGIAYNCVLIQAQRWLSNRVGLASGLVAAGFGSGAFLMSPIETKFINPDNYQVDENGFFNQIDLLERVPKLFILLASLFGICQFIGLIFIANPRPSTSSASTNSSINDIEALPDSDPNSLSISEVFSSWTFKFLFLTMFLNAAWTQISCGLFKAYGMKFIKDDFFLATVSSFGAATNCFSRIIWGIIMDKTSYQVSMMSACATGAALMFTLPGIKILGDKEIFFIWICGMFSVVGATFTLLPSAAHKCFGAKNFGIAYGVLQISLFCAGILTALCSQFLLPHLGFEILYIIFGFCLIISFILTSLIQKTEYGSPIRTRKNSRSTETLQTNSHSNVEQNRQLIN
jgi:OFA family oxalate/formate antiporter-like MFS transporter